ncbi:MAG TPA: glycosyltransferase 87 family protein [Ktedonobacterales bacterium]|nr:glycosyltransferase 87 family protein [Ktedonobacterales bacterium]
MMASEGCSRPSGGRTWRWALRALEYAALAALLLSTLWLSARWLLPNGDVDEYRQYALAFWTQRPLLHALPAEYPPLAIAPFTLTLLPPVEDYHLVFALWMAALTLLGYASFVRFAGRRRALIYILYLLLGAAATLLARFDIVPALVTLAALWATERRRFTAAYALVAAGALLKLYPAFLLPVVAIAHWQALCRAAGGPADESAPTGVPPQSLPAQAGDRDSAADAAPRCMPSSPALSASPSPRRERGPGGEDPSSASSSVPSVSSAVSALSSPLRPLRLISSSPVAGGVAFCVLLVAAGFAGSLALNTAGTLSAFRYAGLRPLQIESTPASVMWLGSLVGIPALPEYSFVSLNLSGPLDAWLRPLSAVALLAGVCFVYWRQARGRLSVGRAFLGCLCIVLVTNKIFSPQYLIWVLPVVAAVEGFDVLWVAICLLTWLDFPMIYQTRHPILTVPYNPLFLPVVALRNGVLLWVTARVIMRRGAPQSESGARRGPPSIPRRYSASPSSGAELSIAGMADTSAAAPDG